MIGHVASLLLAAAGGAESSAPAQGPGPLGIWMANGARLELKQEAGNVVGRLAAEGGACPLPVGTEVLRGVVLDDSLSAQVRVCLVAAQCGADPGSALAVLLVTRQLTGGVHAKVACAAEVRALVLKRPGQALAMTAPPSNERLSHTPPPSPRSNPRAMPVIAGPAPGTAPTTIAAEVQAGSAPMPAPKTPVLVARADSTPVGQTPGRPVGGERGSGYDPRDARKDGSLQGQVDKLLHRGLASLNAGEIEKARNNFQEALVKDPRRAEGYNGVGVTYYVRNDYDEALAWYKRGLEADPKFGDAYYNMACIYALQGHKQLAFRYLRMAALNHYSEREQLENDHDLDSLRGEPEMKELLEQMSSEAKPSGAAGAGKP